MRALGRPAGQCRLPLGPAPDGLEDRARDGARPAARRMSRPAVTITFLGGLGEIGRNCAAFEVDGRIMLLDCGLMFPDVDMLGIDLVLPDFTYLREQRRPHRGLHRHPRPRGPRGGLVVPAARALVPDLRLGAHARPGPQPHRGGRPARPHRARSRSTDGERRKIGPFDVRVHPGHPLGAPRLRHRVPHAAGRHPAHRRLQARPDPGRRSAHRPGPHRLARRPARASGCCCPTRPTPTSKGTRARRRTVGGVLYDLFARARGQADHHHLLRQPHPPRAADRRRRHRLRSHHRHAWACR